MPRDERGIRQRWLLGVKADPIRLAHYQLACRIRHQRYAAKRKTDPIRFATYLAKNRMLARRQYEHARADPILWARYLEKHQQRRLRCRVDPEVRSRSAQLAKEWWRQLRADPVRYEAERQKQRARQTLSQTFIKEHPSWLEARTALLALQQLLHPRRVMPPAVSPSPAKAFALDAISLIT